MLSFRDRDRIQLGLTGVPQGSVPGPQLFSLYITPLARIIRQPGLDYHFFADQIYLFIEPVQDVLENSVGRIEDCVCDVRAWLGKQFLKCNANETDVILTGSRHQTAKVHLSHVTIGGETVAPSTCVRNLGLVIDSGMTMTSHVASIFKSARYRLRNTRKIRKYLTIDACERLVHALTCHLLTGHNEYASVWSPAAPAE